LGAGGNVGGNEDVASIDVGDSDTPPKKRMCRTSEITVDINSGIMSFSPFGFGFLAQW
jgi:hypothetical protein